MRCDWSTPVRDGQGDLWCCRIQGSSMPMIGHAFSTTAAGQERIEGFPSTTDATTSPKLEMKGSTSPTFVVCQQNFWRFKGALAGVRLGAASFHAAWHVSIERFIRVPRLPEPHPRLASNKPRVSLPGQHARRHNTLRPVKDCLEMPRRPRFRESPEEPNGPFQAVIRHHPMR